MIVVLTACVPTTPAAKDSGGDTGALPEERVDSLADADATVLGDPSSAAGNAVEFGGDADGDGRSAVVIAAYFAATVCVWEPLSPGGHTLADAHGCYVGDGQSEYPGYAIAAGGDATGDGVPDLAVGAIGGADAGAYTGKVYLLAGPMPAGSSGPGDTTATLIGEAAGDYAGTTVSFLGDTDGDGAGDLAVGATANDEGGGGGGKVYVVSGPLAGSVSLAEAPAIIGVGATSAGPPSPPHGAPAQGDGCGSVLDAPGDMNGDGLMDLALGVNGSDVAGADGGVVSVFFGPLDARTHLLAEADLTWTGEAGQYGGDDVAAVGDLDGDGLADLVASGDMLSNGTAWFLTAATPAGPLSSATTKFTGANEGDLAGSAMADAGDTDGDGAPDVLIGAYANDGAALDAGAAYLLRGPFTAGTLGPADADRVFWGVAEGDSAGRAVAGGEDADGDGLDDLLVGAIYSDAGGPFAGAAYLVMP